MTLRAYVEGIGIIGPGFGSWPEAASMLSGMQPYLSRPTVVPMPRILAAAERRRTGRVIKLALAVASEATARAGADPSTLASVFSSSGGDGQNCHEICQALAIAGREISPTRFTNSVHNAAAGYWSIATGAAAAANVLCAFDASFTAGLLEALTQVVVDGESVLLVAYDTEYPQPLHAVRPLPDAFGVALVLGAKKSAHSLASLEASLTPEDFDRLTDPALEALRGSIPAARCLPLLRQLALRDQGRLTLEYLDVSAMQVRVEPCV
jgi:Beta-ketoacyl synthase, N-terminal domain